MGQRLQNSQKTGIKTDGEQAGWLLSHPDPRGPRGFPVCLFSHKYRFIHLLFVQPHKVHFCQKVDDLVILEFVMENNNFIGSQFHSFGKLIQEILQQHHVTLENWSKMDIEGGRFVFRKAQVLFPRKVEVVLAKVVFVRRSIY